MLRNYLLIFIIIFFLMFALTPKHSQGISDYFLLIIPSIMLIISNLARKSLTIILKDGYIIQDSEKEILEIKSIVRAYEREEYRNRNVHYFYICFEKSDGSIFELNLYNYSIEDRNYLYKYIEYYGVNIEKIETTTIRAKIF